MILFVFGRYGVAHIGVESAEKGVVVGLEEILLDDFGVLGGVLLIELVQCGVQRPEAAEIALVHPVDGVPDVELEPVVDFLDFLLHLLEVEGRVARLAIQDLCWSIGTVVHLIGVVEGVAREVYYSFVLFPLGSMIDAAVNLTEIQGGTNVSRGQYEIDEGKSGLKCVLFLRVILVRGDLIGEKWVIIVED